MEFTIYFDASGSPDDLRTSAVVVAGFIASAEQWTHFDRNWNDALRGFGVSSLHMRCFAHSIGEFKDWKGDEGRRRRFLDRLINLVITRMRHSFVSAVTMNAYREVNTRYRLDEYIKPYSIAARTCITKVKKWADLWHISHDEIRYVFEDGDADKGNMMKVVKDNHGLTPVFLPKDKSVAFQAADLLAYEHLLVNAKIFGTADHLVSYSNLRYPLKQLDRVPNGENGADWGVHDRQTLEEACTRGGVPLRGQ